MLSWTLAVVAVVLAATGLIKLVDPQPSAPMLKALGLPSSAVAIRCVGVGELGAGLVVLIWDPTWGPLLVAVAYGSFTALMVTLRRRSPTTSCGCIGRWSGPPLWRHVAINAAASAVGFGSLIAAAGVDATETTMGTALWWTSVMIGAGAMVTGLGPRRSKPFRPSRVSSGR